MTVKQNTPASSAVDSFSRNLSAVNDVKTCNQFVNKHVPIVSRLAKTTDIIGGLWSTNSLFFFIHNRDIHVVSAYVLTLYQSCPEIFSKEIPKVRKRLKVHLLQQTNASSINCCFLAYCRAQMVNMLQGPLSKEEFNRFAFAVSKHEIIQLQELLLRKQTI